MLGRSAAAMEDSAEGRPLLPTVRSGPAASLHGLLRGKAGPRGPAGAACLRSAARKASAATLGPRDWKENPAAAGLGQGQENPRPTPQKNHILPTCVKSSVPRVQISE